MRSIGWCGMIAVLLALGACGQPGPSLKQQAEDRAAAKSAAKRDEEFAKSLPPTDAKPIYKP